MESTGKNRSLLTIFLMISFFFVFLLGFAFYSLKGSLSNNISIVKISKDKDVVDKIGVVEVNGIVMDSKSIIELIHTAEGKKDVKAIIMRINSPGGAVGPIQDIYQEIKRINKDYKSSKGKRGKPVYASFGTVAASGGYYIGSATSEIYANTGTITGSIGVVMQFLDLSKVFKKAEIRVDNIKSGKYKDFGAVSREMTKEERKLLQNTSDIIHKEFINDIVSIRKNKIKVDVQKLAQGQIFSGKEAYEYGLIDKIGTLWDAGRDIHKDLKLKGEFKLEFIKKKKKFKFNDFLHKIDTLYNSINLFNFGNWVPIF